MEVLKYIDFPAEIASLQKLDGYGSSNCKVLISNGEIYLVKVYAHAEGKRIKEEVRIIEQVQNNFGFALPISAGIKISDAAPSEFYIRVSKFIEGQVLTAELATDEVLKVIAQASAELLLALQNIDSDIIKANEHDWNLRDALRNVDKIDFIQDVASRKIVKHFFSVFEQECLPMFPHLRKSVIHGDLNNANILIHEHQLSGFIDFGDISHAPVVCELAILLTYIMLLFPETYLEKSKLILIHFNQKFLLQEKELELLPALIATRLCVSVCKSAESKAKQDDTEYILVSEQPAWALLHQWVAMNPIYLSNIFKQALGFEVETPSAATLLERREKVASPSLSLSYTQAIYMRSALFQYMYDTDGHTYLDAYNNIPHIGHSHPNVIKAAMSQMRKLNTNTRYLFDAYVSYSENLLSLFPKSLNKAMLVNSGSEASDLATRIARTVTGRQGIAVLEWSYHGNTQNGIHISAYKFDRKGGKGAQDWILRLPLPKAYLGTHTTAEAYFLEAKSRIEAFESNGQLLAGFIAEPISGCGGQVPLMDGYMALLVPYLKQKGILVISDEVQTGFGRLGQWFWGFEMHQILPDMVVLGKPIANGHPMGAVVTSAAITDAFNNGMEFFSSFGGNPVSCAIANAVIDTIHEEGLQNNAQQVGAYWLQSLNELKNSFPYLGDVRGSGLFIGVECIDAQNKENTALAQKIKNALKAKFILASTDGPLDNTLKMKPPLCFSKSNVDRFTNELYQTMHDLKDYKP